MKVLTAKKLLDFLLDLKKDGHDLSKITINYRYDADSEVDACTYVMEDLFDPETNNILESICLLTDPAEYL
jgi:hypothetical protein